MRVHCDEGVATHIGPEPCAGIREDVGEASAGERIGQPSGHERILIPGADVVNLAEGETDGRDFRERRPDPAWSETLACTEAPCTGKEQHLEFFIEVKSLDIVDAPQRLPEMLDDGMNLQIELERQVQEGRRVAMTEGEIAPHRRYGTDATYDPWSVRKCIETLIGKAAGNFKNAQFQRGPTFALVNLLRLPPPSQGKHTLAPLFYDDYMGGACVSGALWHMAFGAFGAPIYRLFLSTAAVMADVEKRYGIAYSKPGMIKLLHRLGFDYRKPKGLPAKADAAAQEAFVAAYETLLNRLEPDEIVYFIDAVHPEYQSRPAHGWIRRGDRVAVKKGKGRQRMNLMGALCLENGDFRMVETLKMSSATTIDLLERLERAHPLMRVIHVVLDQAPVHRGQAVRDWLARPGRRIELHFLPAYAPNLNAIERLWKLMHEHVTHNRYYDNFRSFAEAIMRFFKTTLPRKWQSIRDVVNDNFDIIRPAEFRLIG